jgi:hypothetical protein
MSLLEPSPELEIHIQSRIRMPSRSWPSSEFKKKLNALPLYHAADYLWGIRPDGTILCRDLQALFSTTVEDDLLTIYTVVAMGSRKFPELGELIPDRHTLGMPASPASIAEYVTPRAYMAGAYLCDECAGTGGSEMASKCSKCTGLGWLLRPWDWWSRDC